MSKTKRWTLLHKVKSERGEVRGEDIIEILLKNRGMEKKEAIERFLYPKLEEVTPQSVGIDDKQLVKAIKRISKAIDVKEQIVVFGDYDVDGITGSAILWETLFALGANVTPYIPHRKDEGYGLSIKGIKNLESSIKETKLIITVDNGIVANEAVDFANEQGIDVIITDHHTPSEKKPDAHAIVHTTNLCGAGVAYLLSKEIFNVIPAKAGIQLRQRDSGQARMTDIHLELAALGTVADLVPLTGANRAIVMHGLKKLQTTERVGLVALFNQAGIKQDSIGVYDIGYIIGPRLNASGRIESAMDSLRLLCTNDVRRAATLASKLEQTNKERQFLLKQASEHAINKMRNEKGEMRNILVTGDESYEEGVIGLVAGKLVEAFYRPAIVLSIGEINSKASVRSVSGFNIIAFLRSHGEYFINVGGHPMAAGFTIETAKISLLKKALEKTASEILTEEVLTRNLKIDLEVPFDVLSQDLYTSIQSLAPFGMANPEPVFASREVTVESTRVLGKEYQHLKLMLQQNNKSFEAIAFGMGAMQSELKSGDKIDIAYVLDENTWNGNTKLQLKIKDIKK